MTSEISSDDMAILIADAADDKLATKTLILDVASALAVTDYFVITSGSTGRQVKAIVDEVRRQVHEITGLSPRRAEGEQAREWVLLDYGDVVVHVFDEASRDHYQLEVLWSDRPRLNWSPKPQTPSENFQG